jgi:hypothetical protein
MNDLRLQPLEVRNQSDRLPAEEGLDSLETQASRGVVLFPALTVYASMPLVSHSATSN